MLKTLLTTYLFLYLALSPVANAVNNTQTKTTNTQTTNTPTITNPSFPITLNDGTTTQALAPRVYIANTNQYQVQGGRIIAGKNINLDLTNLNNAGLLQAGDNITLQALNQITNQGGNIQADNTLTLLAGNNINNISADIKAKDISLTSINGNINNTRFEQNTDYSRGNTKDIKKIIGNQANIQATNEIKLTTNKTINLTGSNLNANNKLELNANNVVLSSTQQITDFYSGNSQNYLQENSTTNLKSQIKAGNININANEQVTIKGTNLQADNQLNIQSKILDIASVKDTTYSQLHSESKGGLFGGGHNDTTTSSTTDNIQSNITADDVNINTTITQLSASKIKAKTVQITTELLSLVSDKDLDFKQTQTDSSGLFTKTITDKGHNKQTKVAAQLQATNQLTINNQQLTNAQQQQLNQLSSADALNAQLSQQLKAKNITLNDVKISNTSWDESSTTLSGLGKIIVQIAANAIAPGVAEGFVNAAMASVQNQITSQLLSSAITGESLSLDPKTMLKTALTAGASQYALSQYGAKTPNADGTTSVATYSKDLSFNTNLQNGLQNTAVTTAVSTAINGGSLGDNLKTNLANSVLTTATAKGANLIGANKDTLGELGHKAAHAALGCAGAKMQGKDCGSGAVGAVVGEVVAELYNSGIDIENMTDSDFSKLSKNTELISKLGTVFIAQGLGKDVEVAAAASDNAVENNNLNVLKVLYDVYKASKIVKKAEKIAKNIKLDTKQLQKKFKHAEDFGIKGNYSKSNASKFAKKIQEFLKDKDSEFKIATYRGNKVDIVFNPKTRQAIISKNGKFISGWKLSKEKLEFLIKTGKM